MSKMGDYMVKKKKRPPKIMKVKKRNGGVVKFNSEKITNAIFKAAVAVGGKDRERSKWLAEQVVKNLEKLTTPGKIPSVEEIQDIVELTLMEHGHLKTAKSYILYRYKRKKVREAKSLLGVKDDTKLTTNSLKVLERRYLKRDEHTGKITESPGQMFRRVAENIALADRLYDKKADIKKTEKEFFNAMKNLEFLPNSPTLMNAGSDIQQLSACFVLPIEDDMHSIFTSMRDAALIHQSGGGTGFSFSRIRPKGDIVKSSMGIASGPISFMTVFNAATEVIKQGGKRRGANMGILRVDHPDIMDFIVAKESNTTLNNFNISIGLTEKFMEAVENNEEYDMINPRTQDVVKSISALRVFNLLVTMAWKNGEPGIIFLDRINRDNPTPKVGEIESTNPCGEQPLLPYESCNLGSVNLSNMIKENKGSYEVDWNKLKKTVRLGVHFLDNVIDMNKFPHRNIEKMTLSNRKIGLGIMGFADMLIMLGIPYNSEEGVEFAGKIMKFINDEGKQMSSELAEKRGDFPNYRKSIFPKQNIRMRNATITTIAPTGTISMIADSSSGIEPLFAISYIKNVMDNTELVMVNPLFEKVIKEEGIYDIELMKKVARHGSIQHLDEIPDKLKRVFVTSHDITPEWHVKVQAAFQNHVDNAVSKTVNFPGSASTQDVEKVYMLAYNLGCKGTTIYRDGSRDEQVLNIETVNRTEKKE